MGESLSFALGRKKKSQHLCHMICETELHAPHSMGHILGPNLTSDWMPGRSLDPSQAQLGVRGKCLGLTPFIRVSVGV